jgi:hypothetical protein
MSQTLNELLALPWDPKVELNEAGDFCVTVRELPYFRYYFHPSAPEEMQGWREALAAHLDGYLATETSVPTPTSVVAQEPAGHAISQTGGATSRTSLWELSPTFHWQSPVNAPQFA